MGVSFDRQTKGSSETEISQFYFGSSAVNQQILGFEVSVEDPSLVEVADGLDDLIEKRLDLLRRELPCFSLHKFFEVVFQVLEYQPQLVLRVQDFFEFNYVGMPETLEE